MEFIEHPHYEYPTELGEGKACVELRIYKNEGKTVVIATDTDTGPSVTNTIEELATHLRRTGIHFDVLVEHYPQKITRGHSSREEFDRVNVQWRKGSSRAFRSVGDYAYDPDWRRITRDEIEQLIGSKLLI